MTVEHARLRELFIVACDLSEPQQCALMDEQCADDPDLRMELQRLLRKDGSNLGILSDEDITAGVQLNIDTVVEPPLPTTIGRYRVKRILGQGGMGVVYLAQQQNPQRDVAVKVIRAGIMNRELVRRFELETAVLGRLQHPGIAKIHEAGVHDDGSRGRPFFAMDYVDGPSLMEYAGQHQLSVRNRLKMFIQICDAVHHAHQRGVIHRDLKPANILVTREGQTQILDFGVARATDSDLQVSTLQTGIGQLIGTLPYMSPEQVTGRALDVDTRSDVYALGVIAYELLTGQQPCDVKGRPIVMAAKIISEDNPLPLASYDRQYGGDLSTIVLKALAKEPDRRYASAAALADDVKRYLNDEPIVARPATMIYQFRKFAKRNKALVASVAVTVLLLFLGVIGTTWGMLKAQRDTKHLLAINEFMSDILVALDPALGNANVTMVEVLRNASVDATQRFGDYPQTEAEVCYLLGQAFNRLSLYDDAIPLYRRAYELRQAELGHFHALTRQAGAGLVFALLTRDTGAATELANELLRQTPPDEMEGVAALDLRRLVAAANNRQGDFDRAEKELREILAIVRKTLDPAHALQRTTRGSLAIVLKQRAHVGASDDPDKDRQEAIELFRDAIDFSNRVLGPDHESTIRNMLNLVDVLRHAGEFEEAEELCHRVIQLAPPRFGADHQFCTRPRKDLAWIRFAQARYEEAADYCIQVVQMARRRTGKDNVDVIVHMTDGLPMLEAGGRYADGEEYAQILLQKLGGGHGSMADELMLYLARFLSATGKTEDAEQIFAEVVSSGVLESSLTLDCLYSLFMGEHQLAAGNRAEAVESFDEALRLRNQMGENSRPQIARIQDAIDRATASGNENAD